MNDIITCMFLRLRSWYETPGQFTAVLFSVISVLLGIAIAEAMWGSRLAAVIAILGIMWAVFGIRSRLARDERFFGSMLAVQTLLDRYSALPRSARTPESDRWATAEAMAFNKVCEDLLPHCFALVRKMAEDEAKASPPDIENIP